MASPLDFLLNQPIGSPPLNPNAPDPRPKQNPLDQFLTRPGGQFLMNLLSQSGFSTMPQSPLAAIGRASIATQQQQQQQGLNDLQSQLLRSRIGLNQARSQQGVNPSGGNVQSQFITEDGKLGFLRRNGEVVVTDQNVKDTFSIQTLPDGSQVGVNRSNPAETVPVVTAEQAREATTRKAQTEASFTLPTDLAGLDSSISTVDSTIDKVKEVLPLVRDETVGIESRLRGDLPGFLGGDPRKLKQQVKSLQANFGFDTLQKMRQASKTGGALGQVSERELDLLINALRAIDLEGDPETLRDNLNAVVRHYENYKREIEVMKDALRQQAGQPDPFEGFEIVRD